MVQTKRPTSNNLADMQIDRDGPHPTREAGCLFALMTSKRPVSRRNRASWYLRQLNRVVSSEEIKKISSDGQNEPDNKDIEDQIDRKQSDNHVDKSEKEGKNKFTRKIRNDTKILEDDASKPSVDAAELVHKDIHLISITSNRYCIQNHTELLNSAKLNNDKSVHIDQDKVTIDINSPLHCDKYLVTPQTRVLYLSKSIASSIILDLSPSIVSVSSQSNCIYSDTIFEALRITMYLMVRSHEIPNSSNSVKPYILEPKIYVSVIAYSPFLVAKNNQILVQNRRITSTNIDQVLAELWLSLDRLFIEIKDLISSSSGPGLDLSSMETNTNTNASSFPPHLTPGNMLRHPSEVLDDILELGIFSTSLLPKLSRRSVVIISDGLFAYTNNLAIHRVKNIALSFVSLCDENTYPDACFGYTPSVDLMKFIAMSTQGFHITFKKLKDIYKELNNKTESPICDNQLQQHQRKSRSRSTISRSQTLCFLKNPFYKLFCWTLHCNTRSTELHPLLSESVTTNDYTEQVEPIRISPEQMSRFFCADRPVESAYEQDLKSTNPLSIQTSGHHDWKVFRHMKRNLDADFEQVLSCLLREGYLIKSIQFKHKEVSKIVARLVLHWRHNLDLERELSAPYWSNVDPFGLAEANRHNSGPTPLQQNNRKQSSALVYGNTYSEVLVHGSYSFLLNLFSDKNRRRSEFRDLAYKQFKQLIEGVCHTHDRLQYLSRYYKDANVSMVPSFLLHGNSLLYEQPHTHKLNLAVENVAEEPRTSEFQEYWQKLSYIDTKGWKNMMHIHTLRLVLEHDQPKFKNIHYQNTNGRYTHVQCRRAMSALSNFIKSYVSFALVEDSTYIKFISHQTNKLANQDDLREVENSATKGFVVIKVNKSLPIVIMKLMFTSGIPDSRRIEIVSKLEEQLINLKLRNVPITTSVANNTNSAIQTSPKTLSTTNTWLQQQEPINILKTRTIAASSETCCIIIKSPLETMLRIYHRNFTTDFLLNNWAHGLPGSCQMTTGRHSNNLSSIPAYQHQQHHRSSIATITAQQQHQHKSSALPSKEEPEGLTIADSQPQDFGFGNRFNLVFGKYLSGFRVIVTIKDLPYAIVSSLAANVLGRICAIMVNSRIRQGFRIAFNNSGILNLVLELKMEDCNYRTDKANCLTQYVLFPPTITNPHPHHHHQQQQQQSSVVPALAGTNNSIVPSSSGGNVTTITMTPNGTINSTIVPTSQSINNPLEAAANPSSKPSSLSGSYSIHNTADSLMKNAATGHESSQDSTQNARIGPQNSSSFTNINNLNNQIENSSSADGEIKFIREYWIEQQYGISTKSSPLYHESLAGKRFPEVVDHLYETDKLMFDCLLTYDVLQLLSDKMSPYYTLDEYFYHGAQLNATNKSKFKQQQSPIKVPASIRTKPPADDHKDIKPSCIIEGRMKSDSLPTANLLDSDTFASRIPLIETEYAFCLTNFLDYCQMASVNMLLFQDRSEFYAPAQNPSEMMSKNEQHNHGSFDHPHFDGLPPHPPSCRMNAIQQTDYRSQNPLTRTDTLPNMIDERNVTSNISSRREHRYSYQSETPTITSTSAQLNNIAANYASLNHLFIETVQKRLKQIHEKELRLPLADKVRLASYLKNRLSKLYGQKETSSYPDERDSESDDDDEFDADPNDDCHIEWRCFLRKGNQDNQMIVLIPSSMGDIIKWLNRVDNKRTSSDYQMVGKLVCPIFVFRCSSSLVNDRLIRTVNSYGTVCSSNPLDCVSNEQNELEARIAKLESDLSLHLGQPCRYLNKYHSLNDELINDLPNTLNNNNLGQSSVCSDIKILENLHFKAFLRKIKNTVLKSRFSSLSDAYSGELFIHKDDICYYMENVDSELQKKYHVSSNLKYVLDFMIIYSNYRSSLPEEPVKPVNPLLTSILLQKCGIYTNLPIARFNESDPLMQQLHDKKLVTFMKCNYNIELPVLTETLSSSAILRDLIRSQQFSILTHHNSGSNASGTPNLPSLTNNSPATTLNQHQPPTSASYNQRLASYANSVGSSPSSGSYMERLRRVQQLQATRSNNTNMNTSTATSSLPGPIDDLLILEAFRGRKICPMSEVPDLKALGGDENIAVRQELHMAEVIRRNAIRHESQQYRRVLKSKASYSQSHSVIDQALKKVDKLGRLEHFCLTPLLFSPSWRSKLAPVRDHTIESSRAERNQEMGNAAARHRYSSYDNTIQGCEAATTSSSNATNNQDITPGSSFSSTGNNHLQTMQQQQQETDERWHQIVCNNYLKEYEQYIQTLGFNAIQVRYQQTHTHITATSTTPTTTIKANNNSSTTTTSAAPNGSIRSSSSRFQSQRSSTRRPRTSSHRKHSVSTSGYTSGDLGSGEPSTRSTSNSNVAGGCSVVTSAPGAVANQPTGPAYNTGYLIKFLNSGCLVFKVGFCKPYVYSVLYSIEGERFNNCDTKNNMIAFLDELDNIKLTMHLHSFTYDYHLRTIYSYISGRQLSLLSPCYHLISFLDEFLKYYQKAPNYARNHIICDEIHIGQLQVSGQQLYKYLIDHNKTYKFEVAEMSQNSIILQHNSGSSSHSTKAIRTMLEDARYQSVEQQPNLQLDSHANDASGSNTTIFKNDHVLIELKREKIRYQDASKEPNLFDCGLLVTHQNESSDSPSDFDASTLKLRYFLLLSNQRDFYPKLVHTHDMSVLNFGCHRPIRMTNREQNRRETDSSNAKAGGLSRSTSTLSLGSRNQEEEEHLSAELLLSSPEISGLGGVELTIGTVALATINDHLAAAGQTSASAKAIMASTANSTTISSTTINSIPTAKDAQIITPMATNDANESPSSSVTGKFHANGFGSPPKPLGRRRDDSVNSVTRKISATNKISQNTTTSDGSDLNLVANTSATGVPDRTICDEEITYLGYFSTDEMAMLQFLQEKAANLRSHMEKIVRTAEVHYRRDFMWSKLMLDSSIEQQLHHQQQKQHHNNQLQQHNNMVLNSTNSLASVSHQPSSHHQLGSYSVGASNSIYNSTSLSTSSTTGCYSPGGLYHQQQIVPLSRNTIFESSGHLASSQASNWVSSYLTHDLSLGSDDLVQLLTIVEVVDLSRLDPQLGAFVGMHINWYKKLLRAFHELKQSPINKHRIHIVQTTKVLLLYMDPNCSQAFVLISIDSDRGSAEMSLLLRDRNDILSKSTQGQKNQSQKITNSTKASSLDTTSNPAEVPLQLDQDCQRLIEDFINFCATFMWSTFLQ